MRTPTVPTRARVVDLPDGSKYVSLSRYHWAVIRAALLQMDNAKNEFLPGAMNQWSEAVIESFQMDALIVIGKKLKNDTYKFETAPKVAKRAIR